MNKNIRITGPAGLGINTTSDIIANIISDLGYNVLTDIEYESRIKGGVNFFDINFSDARPYLSNKVDLMLAFGVESVQKNIESLVNGGALFINSKFIEKFSDEINAFIKDNSIKVISIDISDKYDNTYLLGLLVNYLSMPFDIVSSNLDKVFSKKGKEVFDYNLAIVKSIIDKHSDIKGNFSIKSIGEKKGLIYGNKSVALGAIEGGLEYYSAYPMTPASSILSEIINSKKVTYLQAEDEVAVINSALGASYTGKRSMCGTSGGGFALMSEALSFAVQAEFPITVVLSQRAGPSTGTPTFHEAGDLNYALNPTFGDFEHIVLYPSSIEEAFEFAGLALNLADKYQSIVIILLDKQLSEIFATYDELKTYQIDRGVILDNPPEDYKRYELTPDGISPRVMVGTKNGDFIATSYEHDEYGATSEDPEMKKLMTEKRFKKLENFYKKENIRGFEVINKDAKKMFITTSATSYTLKAFVENNPDFGLIIIKILKPIDEELYNYLCVLQEAIFVESNYSGQLENYITKELGLKFIKTLKISNFRKYDLFPFYYEEFAQRYL